MLASFSIEIDSGNIVGDMAGSITGRRVQRRPPPPRHTAVPFVKIDTLSLAHGDEPFRSMARQAHKSLALKPGVVPPILLTHLPLGSVPVEDREALLSNVRPRAVFSGHTHHQRRSTMAYHARPLAANGAVTKSGWGAVREFTVPTVSYRMGTADVGIGLAVISNGCVPTSALGSAATAAEAVAQAEAATRHGSFGGDGIAYATCWLPSRYSSLRQYAVVGSCLLVWSLFHVCQSRKPKRRNAKFR